jgi:hypothetical protein
MKNTYDMSIKQGEDFYLILEIQNADKTPIDLTGHLFRGQIRRTASDPNIVAQFEFTLLDQITNTGRVQVYLSSSISSAIDLTDSMKAQRTLTVMAYDIESVINSRVTRWVEGTVIFSPEVTK